MQKKGCTEMVKLNRIKYAYSDEEVQQLMKEGYVSTHVDDAQGKPDSDSLASEETIENPVSDEKAQQTLSEEEKSEGKRGAKKK